MGGSIVGQSINLELNKSATALITLNDSNVRTLSGVASGTISLNNFYGKSNFQMSRSSYTLVRSGSGTITPPTGATLMRVAAIGGGGGGKTGTGAYERYGGGGGGCAASKIVQAASISYSVGAGGGNYADGANTTASWTGRSLTGGGGKGAHNAGSGGTASGGDYNFSGGSGDTGAANWEAAPGGGAAGPYGPGGNCATTSNSPGAEPSLASEGWGVGGGRGAFYAGGNSNDNTGQAGGPGGSAISAKQVNNFILIKAGANPWNPVAAPIGSDGAYKNAAIGGGANSSRSGSYDTTYIGGDGAVFVEWFYPV